MSLYDLVVNSIVDEKEADSTYDDMLKATSEDKDLSDADKALIMLHITNIKNDEIWHNTVLHGIKAILDDYKDARKSVVE